MIKDSGIPWVILGHSERRHLPHRGLHTHSDTAASHFKGKGNDTIYPSTHPSIVSRPPGFSLPSVTICFYLILHFLFTSSILCLLLYCGLSTFTQALFWCVKGNFLGQRTNSLPPELKETDETIAARQLLEAGKFTYRHIGSFFQVLRQFLFEHIPPPWCPISGGCPMILGRVKGKISPWPCPPTINPLVRAHLWSDVAHNGGAKSYTWGGVSEGGVWKLFSKWIHHAHSVVFHSGQHSYGFKWSPMSRRFRIFFDAPFEDQNKWPPKVSQKGKISCIDPALFHFLPSRKYKVCVIQGGWESVFFSRPNHKEQLPPTHEQPNVFRWTTYFRAESWGFLFRWVSEKKDLRNFFSDFGAVVSSCSCAQGLLPGG